MIKKRFHFGICSGTQSLVDQVKRLTAAQNIELDISLNSLDDAIPDARRMLDNGVEVILAGSTTGVILMENIDIPIVMFRIEAVDSMKNVIEGAKQAKRIFAPMLRKASEENHPLAGILGVEFHQAVYHDVEGARKCLDKAKEQGFELVMGGGFVTQYAREIGLSAVDFNRSDETVQQAIDSAVSICRSNREAREKSLRYRTILDTASDGVVAVDEAGRITAINRTACGMLDVRESQVRGLRIEELVPNSMIPDALEKNRSIGDSIEKIKSKSYVWNHQPFEVIGEVAGCVSTFSEVSSVMRAENKIRRTLSKGHVARYVVGDILHKASVMKKTIDNAKQFAKTDSNLLITGETGTGKELLVQSVHNLSKRKKFPFVSINCAALPDQLLESELFGYEEGAFTGSKKGGKPGLFELAHKGTIFLDEIGETSEHVQIRLLRVLQEREIMRLGDDRLVSIDVRVIAASNRDLAKEVKNGNFRSDLYFRLNILRIRIPPLRERLEDLPILLDDFVRFYSGQNGMLPFEIPAANIEQLKGYQWPGNVRQLQNFTEQLVLLSHSKFNKTVFDNIFGELIDHYLETQPEKPAPDNPVVHAAPVVPQVPQVEHPGEEGLEERIGRLKEENEKRILLAALEGAKYSKAKAAAALGMSRSTLWRKIKEAGLE